MNIKRATCQALADAIADAVPALAGKIRVAQAEPEDYSTYPSLTILPQRFSLSSFQDDELDDTEADRLLVNVGEFEGNIELRLAAALPLERERLEERLLHYLLSREGTPGLVTAQVPAVDVGGIATLYEATACFALDDAEWNEEFAFSEKRFTFLDLTTSFPALVMRSGVYTIEQLITAITEDLESDTPDEAVQVNDDGTTTQA